MKIVKLGDFATDAMLTLACEIGPDVGQLEARVIKPNLAEISRKLGQENDSRYLAYVLVFALEHRGSVRNSEEN